MPASSPGAKPPKVFRIRRFAIGLNVLVQILTLVFILGIVNYLAFNHYKRWDYSHDKTHVLSDQTDRVLATLAGPLKIVLFYSPDPQSPGGGAFTELSAMLKEYQYASHGKVEVESVFPYKDLRRASELMAKYKLGSENAVIVDYQGRNKVLNPMEMIDFDTSGEMYGQPPKEKDFKGEQVLTSAILEVVEGKQNKVYLLDGAGGPKIDSDTMATFKAFLERQNLKVASLSLMNVDKVPDDASAVMVIGAKYDLTEREMKMLRDYWDKQGRLFVALDPSGVTPRLDAFLTELGVQPQDDRLVRLLALSTTVAGVVRDATGSFSDASPITERLKGVETQFPGQTQSLGITQPPGIHTTTLLTASEGFWGETEYQNMEANGVSYDPKKDISAPLTMAASVEKGAPADNSVKVATSRMVVTGNADFLGSQSLSESNVDFALAALNWMMNREELIGITPKIEQQFTLDMTEDQMRRIEILVLLVIPAAVAMIGVGVWAQRRR